MLSGCRVFDDDCFDQAESLSRMLEGLDLHQDLLQKLTDVLSSTETLQLLLADIRDLSAQVQQVSIHLSSVSNERMH